jgi:hypothetical protein
MTYSLGLLDNLVIDEAVALRQNKEKVSAGVERAAEKRNYLAELGVRVSHDFTLNDVAVRCKQLRRKEKEQK